MKMRALTTLALAVVFAACSSKPEPEAVSVPEGGFAPVDTTLALDTTAVNKQDVQVLDSLALQAYPTAPDSLYIEMAMKAELDSIRRAEGDTLDAPAVGDTLSRASSLDSGKVTLKADTTAAKTTTSSADSLRAKAPAPGRDGGM